MSCNERMQRRPPVQLWAVVTERCLIVHKVHVAAFEHLEQLNNLGCPASFLCIKNTSNLC